MLDIGWPELIVIGAVALVVIGPKDLPKAMSTLGRLAGKARSVVREVRSQIDQLSYETEIAEQIHQRDKQVTKLPEAPASSFAPAAEKDQEPSASAEPIRHD